MKTDLFIKMTKTNDFKNVNLVVYKQFIKKLIYLICKIKPNIAFAVCRLSKHNADF